VQDLYQPFAQPLRQYSVLLASPAEFVKVDKFDAFGRFDHEQPVCKPSRPL
jgi:hypothetical protein